MKVAHYSEIDGKYMDGGPAKGVTGRVLVGKDDGAGHFCMRLIQVDPEGHTPRHSHEWEHEIFVHEGEGAVFLDGDWKDISPGTALFIPGGVEHQMKNTGTGMFSVVCLIPSGPPEL